MKKFEIHITGESSILSEFDALGIKNITVDLVHPDLRLFRTEYMSSFILESDSLNSTHLFISDLLGQIKTRIIRVKIESPYYEEYINKSLYVESHFKPINNTHPLSINRRSGRIMATDREYNKEQYFRFIDKWKNEDIELCLHDSFVQEDFDWFKLYNK